MHAYRGPWTKGPPTWVKASGPHDKSTDNHSTGTSIRQPLNAESTVGHNRVRDCVGLVCSYSDPATDLEVPGLCPQAPTLRPADVLTRALHHTQVVAADVGVRAPHAASAGLDPLGKMRIEKHQKYEPHREDLAAQGIIYEPIIFSAYGRRHPQTTDMLKFAASRAARRRGWLKAGSLLKWWHRQLAAELWRRVARMVHSCMPRDQEMCNSNQDDEDGDADMLRQHLDPRLSSD